MSDELIEKIRLLGIERDKIDREIAQLFADIVSKGLSDVGIKI